jgi:hypothetical protein
MAFPPAKKPPFPPKKPKKPGEEDASDDAKTASGLANDASASAVSKNGPPKAADDLSASTGASASDDEEETNGESSSDAPADKMKGAKENPLRKWAASMADAQGAGLTRPKNF